MNNPLNYVDPFGLDIDSCVGTSCVETINVTGGLGPAAPFAPGGSGYGAFLWGVFNGGPSVSAGQGGGGGGGSGAASTAGSFDADICAVPVGPGDSDLRFDVQMTQAVRLGSFLVSPAGSAPFTGSLASALALGPWNFKTQSPGYQDYTNFHFGATLAAAGVPRSVVERGGGVVNVAERGLAMNLRGAVDALVGVFGYGPYGTSLGDEDENDLSQVRRGFSWFVHCR